MSIVFPTHRIPTPQELKELGYGIAEKEVTEDLVKLISSDEVLTVDEFVNIILLARDSFGYEHRKAVVDAISAIRYRAMYADSFDNSAVGKLYKTLYDSVYNVTKAEKGKTVDKDDKDQKDIENWLSQRDGHGARFAF